MGLTLAGRNFLASALVGTAPVVFDAGNAYLGVGDSTEPFDVGQEDLQATANHVRRPMDAGFPTVTDNVITFQSTFGPSEANFDWEEWGVMNAPSAGILFNRMVEFNGTKQEGQTWIFEAGITIEIGIALGVPTGLAAVAGDSAVTLTWNPSPEPDVTGYNVYVDNVFREYTTQTTYIVDGLTNGQQYAFAITAVDSLSNESDKTPAIMATPEPASVVPEFEGLSLWLDATQLSSADYTRISEWADVSDAGANAMQADEERFPLYLSDVHKGNATVRFLNDWMTVSGLNPGITNGYSFAAVVVFGDPNSGSARPVEFSSDGVNGTIGLHKSGSGNVVYVMVRESSTDFEVDVFNHPFKPTVFFVDVDLTTNTVALYKDGVLVGSEQKAELAGTGVMSHAQIGAAMDTGARFNGDMCEVVLYNRRLGPEEFNELHEYFAEKWLYNTSAVSAEDEVFIWVGGAM